MHGHGPPKEEHPCARQVKTPGSSRCVYCRYLFPRPLRCPSDGPSVQSDPHRSDLRNLFLSRNDSLLNNFEAHLLLMYLQGGGVAVLGGTVTFQSCDIYNNEASYVRAS